MSTSIPQLCPWGVWVQQGSTAVTSQNHTLVPKAFYIKEQGSLEKCFIMRLGGGRYKIGLKYLFMSEKGKEMFKRTEKWNFIANEHKARVSLSLPK